MDPDAALRETRVLLQEWEEGGEDSDAPVILDELTNRLRGLDDWLVKGGALPDDWRKGGRPVVSQAAELGDLTIHALQYVRTGRGLAIHPEHGQWPAVLLHVVSAEGLELAVGMEPDVARELGQRLAVSASDVEAAPSTPGPEV